MLLVGDIGGTNVRLDLYDDDAEPTGDRGRLPATYSDVTIRDALRTFRGSFDVPISRATFGIPGAVATDAAGVQSVQMANRPDERIDSAALSDAVGAPVTLVNDLAAHAASLDVVATEPVKGGDADPCGVRLVVMPGTGLGVGLAIYDGRRHRPLPSEGGHVECGPRGEEQAELFDSLRRLTGRSVTWETVLCGPGLRRLVACLSDPASPSLDGVPDPREITAASGGLGGRATAMFLDLLGQAAGNFALTTLATGGVYLGGAIVNDLAARDDFTDRVTRSFESSGVEQLHDDLDRMPIHCITDQHSGLLGAAQLAAAQRAAGDPVPA